MESGVILHDIYRRDSFFVCVCEQLLTEQDDDTEQDGHQGSGAEPRPAGQRLGVAQLHVALAVAGAHADGQRVGAALHGELAVGDDHRHQVGALLQAVVAVPARQDPRRVVCTQQGARLPRSVHTTFSDVFKTKVIEKPLLVPLLSRTEKLAFPEASWARLKKKR